LYAKWLGPLLATCLLLAAARAPAADRATIRIGTHVSIAAHLLMQKKPELLRHLGKSYDVEWIRFAGSGDAAPALVAGKLDACLATPFPLANALFQSHVPVTVVHQLLSLGFDGHYDDASVVRSDSTIARFADLKGKIFGVNAIGSTVEQSARIMARKSGLDPDRDLTIVEGRPPFLPEMVRQNQVQAATLFQPFFQQAMEKGGLKVLFTVSDVYGGPTDFVFLMVDDRFLKANAPVVRDYIDDYLTAVNWMLDHRDEAVKMYAEQWKMPVEVAGSYLLTTNDYLVRRDGRLSAERVQPVVDALAANHFISQSFDVGKYIDLGYLPR